MFICPNVFHDLCLISFTQNHSFFNLHSIQQLLFKKSHYLRFKLRAPCGGLGSKHRLDGGFGFGPRTHNVRIFTFLLLLFLYKKIYKFFKWKWFSSAAVENSVTLTDSLPYFLCWLLGPHWGHHQRFHGHLPHNQPHLSKTKYKCTLRKTSSIIAFLFILWCFFI